MSSGKGTMPAFKDTLSAAEIDAVAAFVAGEEPAAATPDATATPEPAKVTTADTAPGPDGITVADDRVWVTNASAGTLQRFDAATGRAHRRARWRSGASRTTRSSRAAPSGWRSGATTRSRGSRAAR